MLKIILLFMMSFLLIGCSTNNVKDSEQGEYENTVKSIPITVLSADGSEKKGELIKVSEDICFVRTEEIVGLKRFDDNLSLPIIETEETMVYCEKMIDKDFFEEMHEYYKDKKE